MRLTKKTEVLYKTTQKLNLLGNIEKNFLIQLQVQDFTLIEAASGISVPGLLLILHVGFCYILPLTYLRLQRVFSIIPLKH